MLSSEMYISELVKQTPSGSLAKAAKELQNIYPGIHYHISSGNAEFVLEQLDKGLIDFGIVFGSVDFEKYNALKIPVRDTGVC